MNKYKWLKCSTNCHRNQNNFVGQRFCSSLYFWSSPFPFFVSHWGYDVTINHPAVRIHRFFPMTGGFFLFFFRLSHFKTVLSSFGPNWCWMFGLHQSWIIDFNRMHCQNGVLRTRLKRQFALQFLYIYFLIHIQLSLMCHAFLLLNRN